MKKEDCYQVGTVTKPKGLKGELVLFLDVDIPEEYEEMDSIFLEVKGSLIPYFVKAIRIQGQQAFVTFEDIDSVEKAKELKACKLYLPLDTLPEIEEEDDFYLHEIISYAIEDKQKGKLGTIQNIYEGNQDLIGMDYQGKEILIPIVDEIVLKVDREEKVVMVNLPSGLLDVYLENE